MKSFLKFVAATVIALAASTASAGVPPIPAEANPIPVVLLVDLGSGQALVKRHADVPFLPASVTKVMTTFVAFEQIGAGKLSPDRIFTVAEPTAQEWFAKGTSMYLEGGDAATARDLLHGIMTASANDASVVLAQGYAGSVAGWTGMMNDAARRLGMTRSHFNNPNGWMDGGQTRVTASDLVRLADAMITRYPALYREYSGVKRYVWRDVHMKSHDPTVEVVPGADGIKTGYTREAGYNFLGSAERNGRRLVMVLAGSPTHQQRDAAAKALLEWGFNAWQERHLFGARETIGEASVQGGNARSVPLVSLHEVHATIPHGEQRKVRLGVRYRGPLMAPIRKGDQVAMLEVKVDGLRTGEVPLYAAADVAPAGKVDRIINGFMNLFS